MEATARRTRALGLVLGLGLMTWLLDQLTKYLVVADLTRLMPANAGVAERLSLFYGTDELTHLATSPASILAPVWEHVYVQNPAGAFSFLLGLSPTLRRWIFLLAGCLAVGGIVVYVWRKPTLATWRMLVPLGLLLGGALGNFTDRAVHGYVIDFIHWHWKGYSWPPFNVADASIVIGVFALLLFGGRTAEAAREKTRPESPRGAPDEA